MILGPTLIAEFFENAAQHLCSGVFFFFSVVVWLQYPPTFSFDYDDLNKVRCQKFLIEYWLSLLQTLLQSLRAAELSVSVYKCHILLHDLFSAIIIIS